MPKQSVSILMLLFASSLLRTVGAAPIVVQDTNGSLRDTEAPVGVVTDLSSELLAAARERRLAISLVDEQGSRLSIPAQVQSNTFGKAEAVIFLMPRGTARGSLNFKIVTTQDPQAAGLQAITRPDGQYEIVDNGKSVLRYNYRTIEPGEIVKKVSEGNRIYARARSDYIHPLFGLKGEELTRDWSLDHPHHRGIYWAWPEVDFGGERGDLHALQRVFARPTGEVRIESGPVFSQLVAKNEWMWEDREPIVRELATIRAYRATANGRFIDLVFQFVALKSGVKVARRETDKYGGLNIRMATPQEQEISVFTDALGAEPRRAWADLSGIFGSQITKSGLAVLQYSGNPDYPGEWVQYPELSWCQPTFPAPSSRYALVEGKPLVLRFRLWIHAGGKPSAEAAMLAWEAFHAAEAARP